MIIDCHGHYTTEPGQLSLWRNAQLAGLADGARKPTSENLGISDDEIRASVDNAQRKLQKERGTDLTIFSPRASGMALANSGLGFAHGVAGMVYFLAEYDRIVAVAKNPPKKK